MPVYEYKCAVCAEHFDIEQSITEDSLTTLEGCQTDDEGIHRLKKVFSAVGISFKGDGFYRNDARSSSGSSSSASSTTTTSATTTTDSGADSGASSKSSTEGASTTSKSGSSESASTSSTSSNSGGSKSAG